MAKTSADRVNSTYYITAAISIRDPEMFSYHTLGPIVSLNSDRMIIRQVTERDNWLLADYYSENHKFLTPWEPKRDQSFYCASGWPTRLKFMVEQQKRTSAAYFLLLDPKQEKVWGTANFTQIVRGCFYACYLGYSVAEKCQGQGLMYEGLTVAIRFMQKKQQMHRIMANYMPRNRRSANLLARLGFEKEGYARDYLMINGVWEDHILTALVTTA